MAREARRERDRRAPDQVLVIVVAALLVVGLMMVYSTTFDWGSYEMGDAFYHLKRQGLWMLIGIGLAAALASADYDWLERWAVPIMGGTLFVLILLLIIGEERLGVRRTFWDGSIQPGELAKLTTLVYIAAWVSSKGDQIRDVTYGLIPFAVLLGLIAGLIALQPDLSTAALIIMTCMTAFFLAGADLLQMVIGSVVGGAAFLLLVTVYPYAEGRMTEFVDTVTNRSGFVYNHATAARIALGSGGALGGGFGMSHQKFGYLPVPHTDSIFAVIGEELGMIGCLLVIGLFALLAWRGFRIALRARDGFGMILACAMTVLLVYQAMINVAVVLGLVPFTGMVLPFVTMGGSSLIVSLTAVGILLSVSRGGAARERKRVAHLDLGRRDGRSRLSRTGRSTGA